MCVCNYSGFSKRIPRREHPRVVYIFPDVHRQLYRAGVYINLVTVLKESGSLPSSSYLTHIDRLTLAQNCVSLGHPEARGTGPGCG